MVLGLAVFEAVIFLYSIFYDFDGPHQTLISALYEIQSEVFDRAIIFVFNFCFSRSFKM